MDQHHEVVCPVCGMEVGNSKVTAEFEGEKYTFCCAECKKQFIKHPEHYVLKF